MAAAQPRAIALRLYRQLQCARRQFPADPTRAEGGADLPCVLQARIRQAFEESRNVKEQPQLDKLMEHGQAELHALHTISSHAFAQQVRPNTTIARCRWWGCEDV
jgi:hypothetical protein